MTTLPNSIASRTRLQSVTPARFQVALRIHRALTANLERRILMWMAMRTPTRINSDHLTALGFAAQILAGASYASARRNKYVLLLTVFFIALNWLGDSLDGTLARVRGRQRPKYGFYVDHLTDSFGAVFLMVGLALSGYVHWQIAMAMLVAFLVLSIESFLATYTLGSFYLSHGMFGPTEVRLFLIAGNIALLVHPLCALFRHTFLLFDVGGAIATVGMMGMAAVAGARHTAELYSQERLP